MAEVSPSILAADFAVLGEQVRQAEMGGAKMLHVDVMDGHFVPNISIGIPVVESLARTTDLVLDCHLMVTEPGKYTQAFVAAGTKMVTVHQEACPHLGREIGRIRDSGAAAGVALNPATPLSTLNEVLADVDLVLIMSVHPGFGGQSFLPASLDKLRRLSAIRREEGHKFRIQVDGGVNQDNARPLAAAGCDILVAGSSIFGASDIANAVRTMQARANSPAVANA